MKFSRLGFAVAMLALSSTAALATPLSDGVTDVLLTIIDAIGRFWDGLSSNEHIVIIVAAVAWLIWRDQHTPKGTGNKEFGSDDMVNTAFDAKLGALRYEGTIRLALKYQTNGGSRATQNIRTKFTVQRYIAAMPINEREAARAMFILHNNGQMNETAFDRCRLGLTFGDGNCEAGSPKFKINAACARQYNIYSTDDLIRHHARVQGVTLASSLNAIYVRLEAAIAKGKNSPPITAVYQKLHGGSGYDNSGVVDLR